MGYHVLTTDNQVKFYHVETDPEGEIVYYMSPLRMFSNSWFKETKRILSAEGIPHLVYNTETEAKAIIKSYQFDSARGLPRGEHPQFHNKNGIWRVTEKGLDLKIVDDTYLRVRIVAARLAYEADAGSKNTLNTPNSIWEPRKGWY